MEAYNNNQIKEKGQIISNLESKIEKLNQDILGSNKDSLIKVLISKNHIITFLLV